MSQKHRAVIAGIGELKPTMRAAGRTSIGLMAEASDRAIADAGLNKKDIDALLVDPPPDEPGRTFPSAFAEYLNIAPVYTSTVGLGGASGAAMVMHADAAIKAKYCHAVLLVTGGVIGGGALSGQRGRGLDRRREEFESPYGPLGVTSAYAMIAQRHSFEYGTTAEQRARVAVDQRTNACANPEALYYGQPITVQDVLSSPLLSDPLHMLEIVRPCCGAAAIIVAAADRVKASPHPLVSPIGSGACVTHSSIISSPSLTTSPVKAAAELSFKMADVKPKDINLVSVYDCFTITVIITLEDAGFCARGEGGTFVESTDITYHGALPVNTHGGQLSFGQPDIAGGMSHITEAVRQLRGGAGDRQIDGCELAYVNGIGGIMGDSVSLILSRNSK